jgi:hypothetical protein
MHLNYSFAQFFTHAYGERNDRDAVFFKPVADGFVIVGSAIDSTYHTRGYYVLKVDRSGKKCWDRTISDAFSAYTNGLAVLPNGNIAILGTHAGIIYSALAEVIILDSTGATITTQNYPPLDGWGTSGAGIVQSSDSTFAIAIYTDGFIATNYYSIYSLNSDLSTAWTEFIGYDGSLLNSHSITKIANGGFFALSYYDFYFYAANPEFQISAIRRYSSSGQVLLDSLYRFQSITNSISSTSDGGTIIGATYDNAGQSDLRLIKMDSLGNVQWINQCGTYLNESTTNVIQTIDGGYAILATIMDPILPNQNDILLIKTDAAGDSLWEARLGSTLNETALHVEENDDSSLAILGMTNGFGDNKIFFAIVDKDGTIPTTYHVIAPIKYLCSNDTMQLTIDPIPDPGNTVVWCTGDTATSINVNATGNYYATVYDTSGASLESNYVAVYFASTPEVNLGMDTMGLCLHGSLLNSTTVDFTVQYQWFLNDTAIQGETTSSFTPQRTGVYKLKATNYCATDSAQVFVDTIYNLPNTPLLVIPPIEYVCQNDSLKITAVTDSLNQLQWYFADDFNWYLLNGYTDSIYYANHSGIYFVSTTDPNGCVNYSDPAVVNYDDVLALVNASGPSAFCEGGEVELSTAPGTDFIWNTGDTTSSILVNSAGEYFLTFVDQNGCPKVTDTISISILRNPTVSIGPDTTLCNNLAYILDAGPGYNNYLWNYGATTQGITLFSVAQVVDTEMVVVYVTDTNGCTNSDTAIVIFDVCNGINGNAGQLIPRVFPTQISSGQSLRADSPEQSNSLSVYDISGKMVLLRDFEFTWSDEITLPAGVYSYQLIAGKRINVSGKIVVN